MGFLKCGSSNTAGKGVSLWRVRGRPTWSRSPAQPSALQLSAGEDQRRAGLVPEFPAACLGRPERLCPGRPACGQPFTVWKNPDSPGVPERPASGASEERRLLPTPGQPFVSAEFVGDPGDPTAAGGKGPEANLGAEPQSPSKARACGQKAGGPRRPLLRVHPTKSVRKQTPGYFLLKSILFQLDHVLCRSAGRRLRSSSKGTLGRRREPPGVRVAAQSRGAKGRKSRWGCEQDPWPAVQAPHPCGQ